MKHTQNAIQEANGLSTSLILRQWQPLLLVFIVTCLFSMQMTDALLTAPRTDDLTRWVLQLTMGIFDLIETVFVFLLLSWGIPHVRDLKAAQLEHQPFTEPYLNSFFAEYMRFLAICLLGFLLLIVPGLIAYCFLVFVPYIAIFSKPYRNDQVHAVKYSFALARRYVWHILAVFVVTTALQLALEFLPHVVTWLYVAPIRILFLALSLLLSIWTYSFMFVLFERAVTECGDTEEK